MKQRQIEIHLLDDEEKIIHIYDMFDTVKEARQRAKFMLENPKVAFDDAAEIHNYHKRIHSIRLMTDRGCQNDWFPKFYQANAETRAYN